MRKGLIGCHDGKESEKARYKINIPMHGVCVCVEKVGLKHILLVYREHVITRLVKLQTEHTETSSHKEVVKYLYLCESKY